MDDITAKTVDEIYEFLKRLDEYIAAWDYSIGTPAVMVPMGIKEKVDAFFPGTFSVNHYPSPVRLEDEFGEYRGLDKKLNIPCVATPAIHDTFLMLVPNEVPPHSHYKYSQHVSEMDSETPE